MTLAVLVAGAGITAFALVAVRLWAMVKYGKARFWWESWRQPELAFACICTDPAWKVLTIDPADARKRAGFLGPFRFHAGGLVFAAYVDERQAEASLDRITVKLVAARGRGRIGSRGVVAEPSTLPEKG